ncbi:hypothetical protein GmHk_04G010323 [Glycine max]|nr:hypothetical protein GmHk_04G010323 [Glycine max]
MSMEAHFKKLLAYEHELIQQSHAKDIEKKRKAIALKASFSKEDHKKDSSDDEDVENLNLIVKKFGKFLKRAHQAELSVYLKKHIVVKKGKKDGKPKKSYIAWENNASISSNSSSEEEIANVCLMDDSTDDSSTIEEIEVDSEFEEVKEAFNEMNEEAQKPIVLTISLEAI